LARHVFTVPIPGSESAWTPEALANSALSAGLTADPMPGAADALVAIAESWEAERAPRILICGSIYLAGDILAANGTPPE
jgi:dihydrofolate synthase/folylpolyglutamate synthase